MAGEQAGDRMLGRGVAKEAADEPGPDVDGSGVELLLPVDVQGVVVGPERPARVELSVQLNDAAHGINANARAGALLRET